MRGPPVELLRQESGLKLVKNFKYIPHSHTGPLSQERQEPEKQKLGHNVCTTAWVWFGTLLKLHSEFVRAGIICYYL